MYLSKYILDNGRSTNLDIFNDNGYLYITIPTRDLFLSQFKDDKYNAYDVIVKLLAIEHYYGLNDYGFKLYEKMQKKRINENWNDRFVNLIESVEKNGFFSDSYIETDTNYSIHDGAHRLALSIFFNQENVNVIMYDTSVYRRNYDLEWFKNNDFSNEEMQLIEDKYKDIFEKLNTPYYSIIWTPARKYFSDIEQNIITCESGIKINDKKICGLKIKDFKKFMYDIYESDDVLTERIGMKYNFMINSLKKDGYNINEDLIFEVLELDFSNPDFIMKKRTGLPQSSKTMRIKKQVRGNYKDLITDYYHDIILHITDNNIQNDEVKKVLQKVK